MPATASRSRSRATSRLEFAVSPPFTALYLLYVVAFACAIPALVMGAASIDVESLPRAFGDRAPRRTVAVFSLVFATLLALAWLRGIAQRTWAAAFGWPSGADAVGHVVHALDLGLQVPLAIPVRRSADRRAGRGPPDRLSRRGQRDARANGPAVLLPGRLRRALVGVHLRARTGVRSLSLARQSRGQEGVPVPRGYA